MKRLTDIIITVSALWFVASWIDVIAYQGIGGTDHVWNLFIILSNIA